MVTISISATFPDAAPVARAADALRTGAVVAFPTDTFYGLAVDPRHAAAVARLFAAKGRAATSAIPLIAASIAQAQEVAVLGEREIVLARRFWPGPLTIVAPARSGVAAGVLGGGTTVAVRVPAHAVATALAAAFGCCITATSANRSGDPPAATAADVAAGLADVVQMVLDAGRTAGGAPSTMVEMVAGVPRLLRAGAVPWDRVLESLE
jgi:L-threonylcarbamoyladenylate synthase